MKVSGLNFSYGKRAILQDVCLNLEQGKFYGILGPNGCGKSTLLKNILQILKPASGIIEINGKRASEYGLKELAALIGFVPQKTALAAPLSVKEILLAGRFCRLKSVFSGYDASDHAKVEQMAELLDVKKFLERSAFELSGGEFGRVLLARALVSEPEILLLDEPTGALDMNYAIEAMSICENLTRSLNLTSVIVLHDLNLASLFCDEILMLKEGAVRYRGSASELFTPQIIKEIYGFDALIVENLGTKFILPQKEKM
ncbi:ABC transporter ATP-binding protein [uncultured Campylobacter sp.]|uniref:ABC transporter ATP-binding protein n=1 Tax=uncultured Campylobacter sp. TaxID=218934 RepID=UPI00261FAE5E|nr:ABC transporter ATP-binding protein [uncultured Campylobacter sp.]